MLEQCVVDTGSGIGLVLIMALRLAWGPFYSTTDLMARICTVYPKKYAHGFCFVVVIHWLIFPYPPGLLHWHCDNLTTAPVPAKQPWWIWINTSCEFIMNDCTTTTKQSTTKPCAYFLGYTVIISNVYMGCNNLSHELNRHKTFNWKQFHRTFFCFRENRGQPFMVVTMASKHRFLALSIFGTAIIVFYLFLTSLGFGGLSISEGRPFVFGYRRDTVFYSGSECKQDQASIQNCHPRKSLQEHSCEQLPENLTTGVECIPEVELRKYTWKSNTEVSI